MLDDAPKACREELFVDTFPAITRSIVVKELQRCCPPLAPIGPTRTLFLRKPLDGSPIVFGLFESGRCSTLPVQSVLNVAFKVPLLLLDPSLHRNRTSLLDVRHYLRCCLEPLGQN